MTVTADTPAHARALWLLTLRPRPEPVAGTASAAAVAALVAEGRAVIAGGIVQLAPHPRAGRWTPAAEASIVAATRLILLTLETTGAPVRSCRGLGAQYGLAPEHVDEARQRLIDDGLVRVTDTNATAAAVVAPPTPGLTPEDFGLTRVVKRPKPASLPAPPAPKPAPAPAPAPVASPTPAPAPPPPPAAPQPPPPLPAAPVREPARTIPADTNADTLLRRLVLAAEVSAGLVAAPTRIRTPLGQSPLLDTQLRLAVVLHAAGRPMLASEISRGYLTPGQQTWMWPALEDGVRRGGFICTGGRGGRGARYSLSDPTKFDGVTWESLNAAVEAQRQARERRRAG